jgi:hypothetical protein
LRKFFMNQYLKCVKEYNCHSFRFIWELDHFDKL